MARNTLDRLRVLREIPQAKRLEALLQIWESVDYRESGADQALDVINILERELSVEVGGPDELEEDEPEPWDNRVAAAERLRLRSQLFRILPELKPFLRGSRREESPKEQQQHAYNLGALLRAITEH